MSALKFGTAGIRGIIGQGESKLNLQHIFRIAEGYAKYLNSKFAHIKEKKIIIGRDNRILSEEFTQTFVQILSSKNIQVYLTENILATPIVSYFIKKYHALGGINITASHNPKEYNGVKLYNATGGQLLPVEIDELLPFFKDYQEYDNYLIPSANEDNIKIISNEEINQYIKTISELGPKIDLNNISLVYSPLHGTGATVIKEIMHSIEMKNYFLVENEMKIDANFSHVENPNPESEKAYINSLKLAKEKNADLILVTDPDADRVGLGIKNENDEYIFLNGNETATLIANYLIENKEKNENNYLIYSFVSSTLPMLIGIKKDVKPIEIATGFKWVSEAIKNESIHNPESKFLFAFEESYGSLIDENVSYDKDAFQSLVFLVKLAALYKNNNYSLLDKLEQIYQEYGYVTSKSISIDFDVFDIVKLNSYINKFQNINFEMEIKEIIDYRKGYKNLPKESMVKIIFENNSWVSIRPSGTEPKIKFYIFTLDKSKELSQKLFEKIVEKIKEEF